MRFIIWRQREIPDVQLAQTELQQGISFCKIIYKERIFALLLESNNAILAVTQNETGFKSAPLGQEKGCFASLYCSYRGKEEEWAR